MGQLLILQLQFVIMYECRSEQPMKHKFEIKKKRQTEINVKIKSNFVNKIKS